ncbi:hypothetical protein AAE478_001451 [Parahypoxylon ruwenzoriense]
MKNAPLNVMSNTSDPFETRANMSSQVHCLPRRAVKYEHTSNNRTLHRPIQNHASTAGIQKVTTKSGIKSRGKKGWKKGAQSRVTRELEKRISAMETGVAWLEQRELLGLGVEPAQVSPTSLDLATADSAKAKHTRKNKKMKKKVEENDRYMDDFLLSDEEGEEMQGKGEEGDRLQRADRWIPDMEHRSRPSRKPKNVPYQLWMSYSLLDDYIYRYSLSDEEAQSLPLVDDIYAFQNGGSKPVTPAGFRWDDKKRLVPISREGNVITTEQWSRLT